MRPMKARAAVLFIFLLWSCTEEVGTGTLTVEIWGEEFIEQGIDAEMLTDDWEIEFDSFVVAIDSISAARGEQSPGIDDGTQRVFDLTVPGPIAILSEEIRAGRYDRTSYRVGPAEIDATAASASTEQTQQLIDSGHSIFVEGHARRGDEERTFAWGFDTTTSYTHCASVADLRRQDEATVQLTIHADHLFYDDLVAEEPNLCFDLIAGADSDEDGEVTLDELSAVDIRPLSSHGTGSEGDIEDLHAFISYLTRTLGHIDGEGHCEIQ